MPCLSVRFARISPRSRVASSSPGKRIAVQKHGKTVAVLVPPSDLDTLEALEDRLDLLDALDALADYRASGGVPFVVHSRNADTDTASILEEEAAGQVPGVMHCFSSGHELADKALELGLYISFSGIVTFRNSHALREIAAAVPLDRMLVETDAPFLAPVPMRGKRNEPAYVVHTAAVAAELKGVSGEAFAAASTDNFFRLFPKAQTCG